MASIDGVRSYVKKATVQEKQCMGELRALVLALAAAPPRDVSTTPCINVLEKIIKLRNLSRDVGWMRRLLADLIHESEGREPKLREVYEEET